MKPDKFRRDGTPYPAGDEGLFEWAKDIGDLQKKVVAQTQIGPYWVSTVWLGLDHSFGTGPPLIFETMVFLNDEFTRRHWRRADAFSDDYMWRYATEAEAIAGHKEACEMYRQKLERGDHHLSETEDHKEKPTDNGEGDRQP